MRGHILTALGLVGWRQRVRGRSTHLHHSNYSGTGSERVTRCNTRVKRASKRAGSSGANFWLGFEAFEEKGVIQNKTLQKLNQDLSLSLSIVTVSVRTQPRSDSVLTVDSSTVTVKNKTEKEF